MGRSNPNAMDLKDVVNKTGAYYDVNPTANQNSITSKRGLIGLLNSRSSYKGKSTISHKGDTES